MPGEKIRNLPLNESPSDSAFTYIVDGVGGDGKMDKEGLSSWVNLTGRSIERYFRIENPDDYEITWTSSPDIPVRMSNQPDGSSGENTLELVHPSVVHFPNGWRGWAWWMCVTPYPQATKLDSAIWENPSILVSNDGVNWVEHPSVTNPVAACPSDSLSQGDVGLCYNPNADELIVVYGRTSVAGNEIRQIRSRNGYDWTEPVVIRSHATLSLGSPNLIRRVSDGVEVWRLYYNKTNGDGSYGPSFIESSSPTNTAAWLGATATQCTVNGLGPGRVPWDFQMYWAGGQWFYIPTVADGFGGTATRPVIGTSNDGITFTCGLPITRRSKEGERLDVFVYTTSATLMDTGDFNIVSSGLTSDLGWRLRIGVLKKRPSFLAREVFTFDHRYNISPSSGTVSSAGAMTLEGISSATISNTPTRDSNGITMDGASEFLLWETNASVLQKEWTAIVTFKFVADPSVATGYKTIFLIGNLMLGAAPILGKWHLYLQQSSGSSIIVPQIVDEGIDITVSVSWDGTTVRFGSSLIDDYGGYQIGDLTSITNNGSVYLGAGANSGSPGGVTIKQFRIFDKAAKSNLEGVARFFEY